MELRRSCWDLGGSDKGIVITDGGCVAEVGVLNRLVGGVPLMAFGFVTQPLVQT